MSLTNRFQSDTLNLRPKFQLTEGLWVKGLNIVFVLLLMSPPVIYIHRGILLNPSLTKDPVGILIIMEVLFLLVTLPITLHHKISRITSIYIECLEPVIPHLSMLEYYDVKDGSEVIATLIGGNDFHAYFLEWKTGNGCQIAEFESDDLFLEYNSKYSLFIDEKEIEFTFRPKHRWTRWVFFPSTMIIRIV